MTSLAERASRWGIESEYVDAFGRRQVVPPEALERIVRIVDIGEAAHGEVTPVRASDSPVHCYQGEDPDRRLWALAVQLYGVRSGRNWGHGDFTDLAALIDLAAEVGASGIGSNPLHALFDDRPEQASPYAPNSRLFLNPLYVDLDAVPEFPGAEAAGLRDEINRLRRCEHVDYSGVARVKIAGLHLAYATFRSRGDPERVGDFDAFRREQGTSLTRFASFEVLRRRFPQPWWEWPEPWRHPGDSALAELRRTDGDAVAFYEFVQWIADRQLAACQRKARAYGLPVGLYLDVAVGVDAAGADAWSEQTAILSHLSLGAPPDQFNTDGQNWGISGFHPAALINSAFAPFRRVIAAAMRHASAIRIDHILGLYRLFLIPHGASAREGAYLLFPLEEMLAVLAQESIAHRCIVIGEDLGTEPHGVRAILAAGGIWSYSVLLFERYESGLFVAPDRYPSLALATFSTHDLPTFAGWQSGHDIKVRNALAMAGESEAERARARDAFQGALTHAGIDGTEGFVAVARYLAATPSRLAVVSAEDILEVIEQPNLPGTIDQHPNWRQRLPVPIEQWGSLAQLQHVARAFADAGRAAPKPRG
jgi:4-alpha-glucanotransferase